MRDNDNVILKEVWRYFYINMNNYEKVRGGVKKSGTFRGSGPDHFRPKIPFDAEAFKTCKNTIKLVICVLYPVLGWVFG